MLSQFPVHVTPLPLERVHENVGDHRPAEMHERVVPLAIHLGRDRHFPRTVAHRGEVGFVVVEVVLPRRRRLAREERALVIAIEVHLVRLAVMLDTLL